MLFNKHNLACAKIAAKDKIKPELASVFFAKDKSVATDSVRLLEVSVPAGVDVGEWPKLDGISAMRGCEPFMAHAGMLAERVKLPRKAGLPILECAAISHLDDNKVEFVTSDGETANRSVVKRVDGIYPDYKKVFPTGEPVAELILNGRKLAELLKIMSDLDETIRIQFYSDTKPLVLECEAAGKQRARGLMMMMKK